MIGMTENSYRVPSDIEYTLASDWAILQGSKLASIGVLNLEDKTAMTAINVQLDNGKEYTLIVDIDTIINASEN